MLYPLIPKSHIANKTAKSLGTKNKIPYFYNKKKGNDETQDYLIPYAPRRDC